MKLYIQVVVFLCVSNLSMAGNTIVVDEKTYSCNRPLMVIDGVALCDGKDIADGSKFSECESEVRTDCGYEILKTHRNGGGLVSLCAGNTVSEEAKIEIGSIVCGSPIIGPKVIINKNSEILGSVELQGETVISNSKVSGSGYVFSSTLSNTDKNGSGDIEDSFLANSSVTGSGDVDSSTLNFVNKAGSGDIKKSNLEHRNISGSEDILGQK